MTASTSWNFVTRVVGHQILHRRRCSVILLGIWFFTREPVGDLSLYFFSCITLICFYFELNIYGRLPTIPTKIVPRKKVKGTPLERWNICVNFGFARLIWRPFIRSTEKRGRNHFFEQCSLLIPLRCWVLFKIFNSVIYNTCCGKWPLFLWYLFYYQISIHKHILEFFNYY
jgi:hypothetical protein